MKLEIIKNRLKEAVMIAERATGKNLSLPILKSILLEVKKNSLIIKATNLDIGLEIEIPAKISTEGEVAVNAMVLNGLLNNLPKEEKVIIESQKDNLNISTPSSSTLIKSFPIDDFPVIPKIDDHNQYIFENIDIISGLKSVYYAASVSDIKPEIASVYIYQDGKELVFVATDSFRLAEKRISTNSKDFQPVIIPLKNIIEIIRTLENYNGELIIKTNKNQASFITDSIYLTSRVIDSNFPDYRQIIPKSFKTEVLVYSSELMNALKLSNIFSDKFNQINILLSPSSGILKINSQNQDVGENTISLPAQITGEEMEMSFNAKYILDCFQSIDSDRIIMKLNEKNRPLLISGNNDQSFNYLIMPINR